MSNVVEVEDMRFTFPESWHVEDFDSWYGDGNGPKPLTHDPFRAKDCDLLALEGETLWLIEVKDYTYLGRKVPKDLPTEFALKVFHTLARLMAVAHFGDHEKKEFSRKAICAQRIRVALAVELRGRDRDLKIALAHLRDRLNQECAEMKLSHVLVSNSRCQYSSIDWKQERIPESRLNHVDR